MMEVEERAVFDRIDGVPTPDECLQPLGQDEALDSLAQSYSSGRMHHAWLLSGLKGCGKASLAFAFSKHILSHPDQLTAPPRYKADAVSETVHRQVVQGAHPELLHLTRPWDEKTKKFKTRLSVEEIRRTLGFFGMTAGAGGWRITIVDAADDMNASAANALLKILEEPPKRSIFFVLSHSPGRLLPTIRSRCQALSLQPLAPDTILALLERFGIQASDADKERAAALSEGSARRAIQLISGDVLKDFSTFEKLMSDRAQGSASDWVAAHKLAEAMARPGRDDSFDMFIGLVVGWIANQIRNDTAPPIAALAGWAEVWEKTNRSKALADAFNLDKKQVILSLFSEIFEQNRS